MIENMPLLVLAAGFISTAALLLRTVGNLSRTPTGFATDEVALISVSPRAAGMNETAETARESTGDATRPGLSQDTASLAAFMLAAGRLPLLLDHPIVAGAATYALGNVFVKHFESGGTLLDFKPEPVRDFFEGVTPEIPSVMTNTIKQHLGPLWEWLPENALHYDPNAYLHSGSTHPLPVALV